MVDVTVALKVVRLAFEKVGLMDCGMAGVMADALAGELADLMAERKVDSKVAVSADLSAEWSADELVGELELILAVGMVALRVG